MGDNPIHHTGHVRMMAAVQPFISGAISKTVNLPEEATVEEVEQLHIDAWKLGVKAIAIYRDNCKVGQPPSTVKADKQVEAVAQVVEATKVEGVEKDVNKPHRTTLPRNPASRPFEFPCADCRGFVTRRQDETGPPGANLPQ